MSCSFIRAGNPRKLKSVRANMRSCWELLDRFPPYNELFLTAEVYGNGSGSYRVVCGGVSFMFRQYSWAEPARDRAYAKAKLLAGHV